MEPGLEMYRVAAPSSSAPRSYSQLRSSAFNCRGQYSGEPKFKAPAHSPKAGESQPSGDSKLDASFQSTDWQFSPETEDNFPFRRKDVPIAFGGLSEEPGSPIDPSLSRAAASIFAIGPHFYDSKMDSTFEVHDSQEFFPGCVVKLVWFDDSEMGLRDDEELSSDEFIRRRRARKGTIRLFVLFRTFTDYSMAVPIHTYSLEELQSPGYFPKHHAIIYSGKRTPPVPPGENHPIRVDAKEELSISSRLNYAGVFTIEHSFRLVIIGRIAPSDWEAFATSYADVQSVLTGYEVEPPSAESEVDPDVIESELAPIGNTANAVAVSPTIYQRQTYDTTFIPPIYTYSTPDFQTITRQRSDSASCDAGPSAIQVSQTPNPPDSNASATSPSSSTRRSSTQEDTSNSSSGSWVRPFASEAPLHQFRALNSSTSQEAEVGQRSYSPLSVNYAQIGIETLR